MKQPPQDAVLNHCPKRLFVFSGGEGEAIGLWPVTHLDAVDRATMRAQRLGHADNVKHPPAGRSNRAGTTVKIRRERRGRSERIDDTRSYAMRVERERQCQPDQSSPEDDDVA